MDIEEREDNEEELTMLRKNFDGGDAVNWMGDLYIVVDEDCNLVDPNDDPEDPDRAKLFAVSLENGSTLFEDEHDTVIRANAKVIV